MHQYDVGELFKRVAIDIPGRYQEGEKRSRYLMFAMDYFTKWLLVYAITNQEALPVVDGLVTNLFCRFGVPRGLHSDQGQNF
jgi:hypothetical protein